MLFRKVRSSRPLPNKIALLFGSALLGSLLTRKVLRACRGGWQRMRRLSDNINQELQVQEHPCQWCS